MRSSAQNVLDHEARPRRLVLMVRRLLQHSRHGDIGCGDGRDRWLWLWRGLRRAVAVLRVLVGNGVLMLVQMMMQTML